MKKEGSDKTCPVCRMIIGLKPGKGKPCGDCVNTQGIMDAYWLYKIEYQQYIMSVLYTYFFPVLLIVTIFERIYIHNQSGYTIRTFLIYDLIPWGFWVFNVFFLFRGRGVTVPGLKMRLAKSREDIFLKKVSGIRTGEPMPDGC